MPRPEYPSVTRARPSGLVTALMAGLTLVPPQPAAAQCSHPLDPTLRKIAEHALVNGQPTRLLIRRTGTDRKTGIIVDSRKVRQYAGFVDVNGRALTVVFTDDGETGPDGVVDCRDTIDFYREPPPPFTQRYMGDEVTDWGLNGMSGRELDFARTYPYVFDPRVNPPYSMITPRGDLVIPKNLSSNPGKLKRDVLQQQKKMERLVNTAYHNLAEEVAGRLKEFRPGLPRGLAPKRF